MFKFKRVLIISLVVLCSSVVMAQENYDDDSGQSQVTEMQNYIQNLKQQVQQAGQGDPQSSQQSSQPQVRQEPMLTPMEQERGPDTSNRPFQIEPQTQEQQQAQQPSQQQAPGAARRPSTSSPWERKNPWSDTTSNPWAQPNSESQERSPNPFNYGEQEKHLEKPDQAQQQQNRQVQQPNRNIYLTPDNETERSRTNIYQ